MILNLHSLWRWQMIKNAIILVVVSYFFKYSLLDAAAVCLICGVITYAFMWFAKKNLNNQDLINSVGKDVLIKQSVKTLLSSLSWFVLSAILYFMPILSNGYQLLLKVFHA
jgi:hypothetical protein